MIAFVINIMLAVDSLLKFPCQYEEAVFDQLVEFS